MAHQHVCSECGRAYDTPVRREIARHPQDLLAGLTAHTPLYKRWNDDRAAGKPLPAENT